MADITPQDTFAGNADERRDRSSAPVLSALRKAEDAFRDWQANCDTIDEIYSRAGVGYEKLSSLYAGESAWRDNELDLFWASFEVMKPAVYCRPPRPAIKPLFSDSDPVKNLTAELLERVSISTFAQGGIDDVMREVRDDVLFAGRGVLWLRYETDGGQRVCVEHLDRKDFLHETARTWSAVGWVAGGFWLDFDEMKARFGGKNGVDDETLRQAKYTARREVGAEGENARASARKCRVWEVWHKADNRTYWVTEGVDVLLDDRVPQLKLSGFFPCPKPAYATRQRRSLIPVPDWNRYAVHFGKINEMTARIYALLNAVKMKGLIAAGGDIGNAVEQALSAEDDSILIPVPGAALLAGGNAANLVQWIPLAELATTITGLIQARGEVIANFYELSGISDIMRGATEAEETLGAQQLKSQYGSVRVREKIEELQRCAAGAVKIASEIEAEHFTPATLLEMSQMAIPSKADLKKRVKEIEDAAREELEGLAKQGEQAAAGAQGDVDPAQAQQMFQQAQQAALAKYGPMLAEVQKQVPIEDVMTLLRDDKARGFAFEVESDSTILTDEMQEKASRNEFLAQFSTASQSLMGLAALGEQGAKLAGEMLKFTLAPYRAGRQLDSAIDAFIEAAPQMAAAAQGEQGDTEALAEANKTLAEAEMTKAKAAVAGVEAKAALDKAEMQRKLMEMQQKAQADQMKAMAEAEKLRQSLAAETTKRELVEAQVNKLTAETAAILAKIGLDVRQQNLAEYQAAEQSEQRQVDNALAVQGQQAEHEFRERGEERADRQQAFTEQQEPGQ